MFEIIHDSGIGYATEACLIAFDKNGCLIMPCSKDKAQYIGCLDNDIFYHADWMQPEPKEKGFPKAIVNEIKIGGAQMSAVVTKVNDYHTAVTKEFIVDSVADIENLPTSKQEGNLADEIANQPCAAGSVALVCGDDGVSSVYILNPSDKWVEL